MVSVFYGRRALLVGAASTREVQMTSRSMMFIKLSQLTRCPLYVSPLLSSMSCNPSTKRDGMSICVSVVAVSNR